MLLSTLCDRDDIVTPITQVDERQRILMGGKARNFATDSSREADYLAAVANTAPDRLHTVAIPRGPFVNHMSLAAVLARVPDAAGFETVFVERNPYAKILSLANHLLGFDRYRSGGDMIGSGADLARAAATVVETGRMREVRNIDLYRMPGGVIAGTRLRYESLAEDLEGFLVRIAPGTPLRLPHAKRGPLSNTIEPQSIFTSAHLRAIAETFADEFAAFGYPSIEP